MVNEPRYVNQVIWAAVACLVSLMGIFLGFFAVGASRLAEVLNEPGWAWFLSNTGPFLIVLSIIFLVYYAAAMVYYIWIGNK
jgi:hypothetical protein